MAKVTIYLADDLAERVRAAGVSMSPVCQAALEKEVQRTLGMEREPSGAMTEVSPELLAVIRAEIKRDRDDFVRVLNEELRKS